MAGVLNDMTVLTASILLPRMGAWHAELELDGDESLAGAATLSYPGWSQSLLGTVAEGGQSLHGRIAAKMMGGAAKLNAELPPKSYMGTPIRLPIVDVIEEAGEQLSTTATAGLEIVLKHWVRSARSAADCLQMLIRSGGFSWRFLPNGTFWFGDETWPEAELDYDLMDEMPKEGAVLIATEDILLPGTTFRSRRVERVHLTPHKSRATVWFAP